jgi:MFS family permease
MPREIKRNSNLKNYLIIINLLGIGISLLPFVILLAKDSQNLSFGSVGIFLIFRTIGMLIGSLSLYFLANRFTYKKVLIMDVFLGSSLPIIALLTHDSQTVFPIVFLLAGIFISTFKISMNGMLIEISSTENRTLYAGMSGAGNILTSLFPLFAGVMISILGFNLVFGLISALMLLSFMFIRRLSC